MTKKIKHYGKKIFCRYSLQCFFGSKVLECQTKKCLAINYINSVFLSKEGAYINFQIFERSTKAPSIIYGDFEYALIPSTENIDFAPNTKNNKIIMFAVMATN